MSSRLLKHLGLAVVLTLAAVSSFVALTAVSSIALKPAPAGAATIETVTPNTNLLSGQSVSVQGSATGMSQVLLIECDASAVSAMGSPYNPSWCDNSHTVTTSVDSSGNYSTNFTFEDPLPTANGSIDCSVLGSCVLVADNPNPGDVVADSPVTGNSCNGVFSGGDSGRSFKSTDAGSNGSSVTPGQTITVTLTWTPSDYPSGLDKTDDCVSVGGAISTTLSVEHKPAANTGTDTFSYQVPANATAGEQICDRGAVHGSGQFGTEKTNALCYTVGPGSVTPEVPFTLALPISAIGIIGGTIWFRRRRTSKPKVL
jgi:hypothetical protein